jgi:hypothetical protein
MSPRLELGILRFGHLVEKVMGALPTHDGNVGARRGGRATRRRVAGGPLLSRLAIFRKSA